MNNTPVSREQSLPCSRPYFLNIEVNSSFPTANRVASRFYVERKSNLCGQRQNLFRIDTGRASAIVGTTANSGQATLKT